MTRSKTIFVKRILLGALTLVLLLTTFAALNIAPITASAASDEYSAAKKQFNRRN